MRAGNMENAIMETSNALPPPRRVKLLFWLVLGLFSTAFAEVTCNNEPFAFFTLSGYIVIIPVYLLHVLLLTTVVVRSGRPVWPILCMAGALFGLYEAYITKVVWYPVWLEESGEQPLLHLANVAWIETAMLILWWHPLMAFVLPLIVAEACLTASRSVWQGMPSWIREHGSRRVAFLLAGGIIGVAGLTAAGPTELEVTFLSVVGTAGVLAGLTWFVTVL